MPRRYVPNIVVARMVTLHLVNMYGSRSIIPTVETLHTLDRAYIENCLGCALADIELDSRQRQIAEYAKNHVLQIINATEAEHAQAQVEEGRQSLAPYQRERQGLHRHPA